MAGVKKNKGIGRVKVEKIIVTAEDIPEVERIELEEHGVSVDKFAKGLTKFLNMKPKRKTKKA